MTLRARPIGGVATQIWADEHSPLLDSWRDRHQHLRLACCGTPARRQGPALARANRETPPGRKRPRRDIKTWMSCSSDPLVCSGISSVCFNLGLPVLAASKASPFLWPLCSLPAITELPPGSLLGGLTREFTRSIAVPVRTSFQEKLYGFLLRRCSFVKNDLQVILDKPPNPSAGST